MRKAYLYPLTARGTEITNPYLSDLMESLSGDIRFLNRDAPSDKGILDMLPYLKKIDIIFLNWIEDLPEKKGGIIQSFIFLFCLTIFKIRKIKIFYTLHNRESHFGKHLFMKKFLKRIVIRQADYILCHASEGLNIVPSSCLKKARYIPHPFREMPDGIPAKTKDYDILIWGTIKPYKGIDTFLKFLESAKMLDKYRICIVGKIVPITYEQELKSYSRENIHIENRFIDDRALHDLISRSAIVLFTYREKSVLSSGALVYSLSQGAAVIGPNAGAFRDLHNERLLDVFEKLEELPTLIDTRLKNPMQLNDTIHDFIRMNTWKQFGKTTISWITLNDSQ